jgi:hypothetical protein
MATRTEETPSVLERYKPFIAIGAVAIAFIMIVRMFFFGDSPSSNSNNKKRATTKSVISSTSSSRTTTINDAPTLSPSQLREQKEEYVPTPVIYEQVAPSMPEVGRNIFAFYVPPPPTPKPSTSVIIAAATPAPTPPPPPLILASVSPSNVYARTGDFTLEVTGDKFTPATRINIEGRELATRFISPQQLSAAVPASLIAGDGARTVKVQTPDGVLFSNTATLNVQPPPVPNYTYVGIIGGPHYNDTAVLKDKNSNDLLNVQRGDIVGGRFRITSISERELVLTDTSLRVKHTLAFSGDAASTNPSGRNGPTPPRPAQSDDDEP